MDHPKPQSPISSTTTTPTAAASSPFLCNSRSGYSRCFCLPKTWQRMEYPNDARSGSKTLTRKWWRSTVAALMKAREWSEIVAGPRWKTFIRRFNRNSPRHAKKFCYDPLSYSLNFDASPDRDFDFGTRYVGSSKGSMDFAALDPVPPLTEDS